MSGHTAENDAPVHSCQACGRVLAVGESAWADDWRVLDVSGWRMEVRYTCDTCAIPPEAHPCGHVARVRGCGGCDPGAVEFVRDDGGPWVRVLPPAKGNQPHTAENAAGLTDRLYRAIVLDFEGRGEAWTTDDSGDTLAHAAAVVAEREVRNLLASLRCECCQGRCTCGGKRVLPPDVQEVDHAQRPAP